MDRKRVYLIGHSNGGFMAYRMACQSADLIAGIASLAGTDVPGPRPLPPSEPVNILHIHGTADDDRPYRGGALTIRDRSRRICLHFPARCRAVQIWAGYNGASDPVTDAAPSLDLDSGCAGAGHGRHALHELPARRRRRTVDDQRWRPRPDALLGVFAPGHRLAPGPSQTVNVMAHKLDAQAAVQSDGGLT